MLGLISAHLIRLFSDVGPEPERQKTRTKFSTSMSSQRLASNPQTVDVNPVQGCLGFLPWWLPLGE